LLKVNGRQGGYRNEALAQFYAGLIRRFREIPGVRAATASDLPLVAQSMNDTFVVIPGRPTQPTDITNRLAVDPAFLQTMQIPIVAGRDLTNADLAAPAVAVVNQKFAATFFPDQNAVGRQFTLGKPPNHQTLEVVGIAREAHYSSLQEKDQPVIYIPYTYGLLGLGSLYFELRTAGNPLALAAAVRRVVHDASPDVSITQVSTQAQRIEQTISQERTFADLGTCFAILALAIACVGLYGAMAYTVARRTGEIGIRMALGAQRRRIIWMVLREVLALTAAGLLLGYVAAHYATHFVASFLYELKPNDPLAIAAAVAILLAAALIAGYAPAHRASRIDPASALRSE
jgi:predicted permease